jgi:DNA-directed RNA polymerase subunit RPC12/RpoP
MAITFSCSCGRDFTANEDLAGRQVRCKSCGAILVVPGPPADAEVVACEMVPAEAGAPDAPPRKRKKKRKKRRRLAPDPEKDPEEYKRWQVERAAWNASLLKGGAFISLGLVIIAGAVYMYVVYKQDFNPAYSFLLGVLGVAAVGKGILGMLTGQFFGEED